MKEIQYDYHVFKHCIQEINDWGMNKAHWQYAAFLQNLNMFCLGTFC